MYFLSISHQCTGINTHLYAAFYHPKTELNKALQLVCSVLHRCLPSGCTHCSWLSKWKQEQHTSVQWHSHMCVPFQSTAAHCFFCLYFSNTQCSPNFCAYVYRCLVLQPVAKSHALPREYYSFFLFFFFEGEDNWILQSVKYFINRGATSTGVDTKQTCNILWTCFRQIEQVTLNLFQPSFKNIYIYIILCFIFLGSWLEMSVYIHSISVLPPFTTSKVLYTT